MDVAHRALMTRRRRLGLTGLALLVASLALAPAAGAWIYWGHFAYGKGVGRAALDGTQSNESFVPAPPGTYGFSRGVAVDANHLYWGTHGLNTDPAHYFAVPSIGRSNVDGTNPNYSFTAAFGQSITGLSVSPTHLYWTAPSNDYSEIGRTPVAGGQQYQGFGSVFGQPNPRSCGVATDGSYVYWANPDTYSVGRATLADFATGKGVEGQWLQRPASAAQTVSPCGVAVDDTYVYWGVFQTSTNGTVSPGTTIGRALKSDGSGATDTFAGGGRGVRGLAIGGSFLYASNWNDGVPGHGSIGRASLSGGGGDADFVTGLDAPYSVAVDGGGPAAAPPAANPPPPNYVPPLAVGCSGCSGGGGGTASSVPPDFSRVWGTHATFAPAPWSTPVYAVSKASATPKGTVFNYILDKPGTVRIAIVRSASGRRSGKGCQAPSPRNKTGRACRRQVTLATLTRVSHTGRNQVPFSGRILRRALAPGAYSAIFTARAATGRATKVKTFRFRIVRP